ncbi:hypothetical protein BESB_080240 [Besnoitia besnoiti]|uniref:Uncharacterized protein n=1 Tax=Besnoitia besnoiti TaxID=94643 RepID=A0A2A9M5Q5_BESBE|nr:hypothetical protein BESB_080240 [Besnoitia besnoiti]PFH33808.1 hypothetical protein BESB_080240 [Besnoitia besnoiti]
MLVLAGQQLFAKRKLTAGDEIYVGSQKDGSIELVVLGDKVSITMKNAFFADRMDGIESTTELRTRRFMLADVGEYFQGRPFD